MDLLTTKELAEKWRISTRRITTLCNEGRIDGAVLKGTMWLIPEDAVKPKEKRRGRKSNKESM